MTSSIIQLKNISLAQVLAEISKKKTSELLQIRQLEEQLTIRVWCWENKIVAVKGFVSLIEKIQYYNWLKPKLIVSLQNENLYEKPLGEKLLKVYGFKEEQIEQLFQEQIKELYNLFSLDTGTVEVKKITSAEVLPYWEMTGCEIKISDVIYRGIGENLQKYSEDFPETCLTINSTEITVNNSEINKKDSLILKFTDSNKTIKQIAKELKIKTFQVQQQIYFLQLMGMVELSLPTNRLVEIIGNKSVNSLDHKSTINFEYRHSWKTPLITISILNLLVIILTVGGIFEGGERSLLDRFFRLRGSIPNQDITIITVDDEDIEQFPTYPIADEYLAQTIENIRQYQPSAIGMDIYRNIPQPPGYEKLLEIYHTTDNLIGVKKAAGKKVSPAKILAEKNQVAFSDLLVDSDGIVRRSLISLENENGTIDFSLGAYLALFSLSKENIKMAQIDIDQYLLGQSTFEALTPQSGLYWGSNDFSGLQTLINYKYRSYDFNQVSFWKAYKNQISPELIQNKIVIIGVIADSEKDFAYTPFSKNKTGLAEAVPGVLIHANIAAQFLDAAHGKTPMLGVLNKVTEILLIIGFSLVGIAIGIVGLELNLKLSRDNPQIIFIVETGGLSILILFISYACFLNGLWIPTIAILVSVISSIVSVNFQYKQELENLIYGDKITKTANRRYFDKNFNKIFNDGKKEGRELALILCKINSNERNFIESKIYKNILKRIAEVIIQAKEEHDLIARYGVDSLAVVLQNINQNKAEFFVESLRKNIENELNKSQVKIDFDLGFTTSKDFTSPMDFLMVAINNLKRA